MADKKEVVKAESVLPALPQAEELREVFQANLEGITPSFPSIKIPAGGGLSWEIPTDDGEPDSKREITGVIIDHYPVRSYWSRQIGQGAAGVPPDCFSNNGIKGSLPRNQQGEFGDCATCRFSQWGSAPERDGKQGRGQACKSIHRVFLLTSDSIFPVMFPLPPSSGERTYPGSFRSYMVGLGGRLKKSYEVVTRVSLSKDRNADGIEFAKAMFKQVGELSPEERKQVTALRELLGPAMRQKPIEALDDVPSTSVNEPEPWEGTS